MKTNIITTLLDTDLYKFTMQQCALRQFSDVWVKYSFKSRKELAWTKEMHNDLMYEIDCFCHLSFTSDELCYLASLRFIKKDYIEFLKLYRPLNEHVKIDFKDEKLSIKIEGPWYQTILWEIPMLAMVSEVYYRHICRAPLEEVYRIGEENLIKKIDSVNAFFKEYVSAEKMEESNNFRFSDFGTRRRFSCGWQDRAVLMLKNKTEGKMFVGTSNVSLAKKHGLVAVGTNAHEYYQIGQALAGVQLVESQKYMLQSWVNEYRGDLGIALSDTLGIKKFLKDFDLYFAKLYDGVRHDSGDPFIWGNTMIEHYKKLRIEPNTKTFLFSDSLDFQKAFNIYKEFGKRIKVSFGIGTHITNDFIPMFMPLNIVIKLEEVNGKPVAKISDDGGKEMCSDEDFLRYLKKVIED